MNIVNEQFMHYALFLAKKGIFNTSPNPNVGCVIVKDNKIIGEGYHYHAGGAHAEIIALKKAGNNAVNSIVYITLEPCSHYSKTPPCVNALINAGIKTIVVAMQDPNPRVAGRGLLKLREAGIEVIIGMLMDEAKKLNLPFIKRMSTGLPYVQVKIAVSLDGKTALISDESKWITSGMARQDVQFFRAQVSAILTTSKTVLLDNPYLNVRWSNFSSNMQRLYHRRNIRQPIRIILDINNQIEPKHLITKIQGECWLIRKHMKKQNWIGSVKQIIIPTDNNYFDLDLLMIKLANYNINSVLVETGSNFTGQLLATGLIDELIIYIAPRVLGSIAKGMFDIPVLKTLKYSPMFKFVDIKPIGTDLRVILHPLK
uniref:Riboflavin biosynthesis protein RibD n=1 Tax=Candidatus Aschnera chinzeii TaxID=1485666 RepID=A0AAT9G4G1_9ENTR|nr:MAG: bifunctional diaminohydroxyphosphoribosylaminopyrimidine deaminase/5-amino-6-(5-phosphoribosylamino)uracil reductase RibD [Candidatus Aschnera chinzeii]